MIPSEVLDEWVKIAHEVLDGIDLSDLTLTDDEELGTFDFENNDDILWVANGMTKAVICVKGHLDYVIKVPIREAAGYKKYSRAFYKLGEVCSDDFSKYLDWDYCAVESILSKHAEDEGVAEMLVTTQYLTDIDGIPVYISPMAGEEIVLDDGYPLEYTSEQYNSVIGKTSEYLRLHGYRNKMDEDMGNYFVLSYGFEMFKKLVSFIVKWNISDLHEGNVACGKDGKIKLIDCAGFSEKEDY